MLTLYSVMWVLYPRAATDELPIAPDFNDGLSAMQALMTLAFLGEPLTLNLSFDVLGTLSMWELLDVCVWVAAYVFFVLMSIVLLLNLLIAMLSSTYARVQENATLECRLAFARAILRFELTAEWLGMGARVGQPRGEGAHRRWYIEYRVQTNGGRGGARSIFEDDEDDGEYGVGGYEDPEPEIEISTSGSFIVETVKDGGGRRRRRRTPFQVPWEAAPTASRPSEAEASPPSRRSSFSGAAVDRLERKMDAQVNGLERKLDDVLGALASARRVSVEAQLIASAPLPAPPVEVAARRGSAMNAAL